MFERFRHNVQSAVALLSAVVVGNELPVENRKSTQDLVKDLQESHEENQRVIQKADEALRQIEAQKEPFRHSNPGQ